MELFNLSAKKAIVTGAGRGLGKGVAIALAKAGADVFLVGNEEEELREAHHVISNISNESSYHVVDVRDSDSMKKVFQEVFEKHGSVDILVNAAGVQVRKPFLEITEEEYDWVLDVNLKSIFHNCQIAIPYMLQQGSGKIINFASLTSAIGIKHTAPYGASKGGVAQLTKTIAIEHAEDGIQINAIGPGYYESEMSKVLFQNEESRKQLLSRIPMNKTGKPSDLAGTAIFLASAASNYITGQTIYVDGGWLIS